MPAPKTLKTPTVTAIAEPAPDWVYETVPDVDYQLVVCHEDFGEDRERINMTRSEYVAIKLHLAKMRGYAVEAEEEAA